MTSFSIRVSYSSTYYSGGAGKIEAWRQNYSLAKPYAGLGWLKPAAYREKYISSEPTANLKDVFTTVFQTVVKKIIR